MSELQSEQSRVKSKEEYSRNVKKLKVKLMNVRNEIETYQRKVQTFKNTSNDKMIAMKIAKFCKERKFTPEMLFRFADRRGEKSVTKIQFQNTLTSLGLKLSKEETMRLEYLIDEDLSGSISKIEFIAYLDAFGIKKEFTPGETVAHEIMQKLDLDKLLQTDSDIQNRDPRRKQVNLLNYQDFLKYCHKHFKELKDKEIATIFQRLQRNQLINLQHFLDYLAEQREQKKKQEERNKRNKEKGNKMKREESMTESMISRSHSLKGLIQTLLRRRSKNPLFHSSQFRRLQVELNRKRGELTTLFKAIDSKRKSASLGEVFRGSFGFNQLINYFVDRQEKTTDLAYAFELMGHKFSAFSQTPSSMISQYTENNENMTEDEFKKFMENEFQVVEKELRIVSQLIPRQNGVIKVKTLIDLMKTEDSKDEKVFIRPGQGIASTKLVFRNGLMALRCCLDLQDKLIKARQTHWDDYEFGPTETDQFGQDSLDMPMPTQQVLWQRVQKIGMNQFYEQGGVTFSQTTTTNCPHELIGQSLLSLAQAVPNWLYPSSHPDSSVREVTQKQLGFLFKGIYPQIFHYFAKYGIYVIKVWVEERWRYVVIDDKIPCMQDKKPFFSSVSDCRYSFISLVEKALAKMYGTYKAAFEVNSTQRYLMEMTGLLCLDEPLNESMPQEAKNKIWADIVHAFTIEKLHENQAKKTQLRQTILGLFKGAKSINTNFPVHLPLKVTQAFELSNPEKKNKHKSHRLLAVTPGVKLQEQSEWNKGWSKTVAGNKYSKNRPGISECCESGVYNSDNNVFLNFKLFRKGFNLIKMHPVDWQINIILRKELEFQPKFKCRYEITAKSTDLELVVFLKRKCQVPEARVILDVSHFVNDKETVKEKKECRSVNNLMALNFEAGKTIILEFYVDNFKAEQQYLYGLTFYFSHPRFDLKQRDRHLLFRYVSPFEEESRVEWGDFEKEERQFIYRHFYKGAEPRGCCGCL